MYKVEITNSGDTIFKVKEGDYSFTVDTKGKGVSPPAALLASLGSCIGVYIRKYCEGAGLSPQNFKITVEAELSKESPLCFKLIRVQIDLAEFGFDERRRRALLEFIKNCPVHNTLKGNPLIELSYGKS